MGCIRGVIDIIRGSTLSYHFSRSRIACNVAITRSHFLLPARGCIRNPVLRTDFSQVGSSLRATVFSYFPSALYL